MLLNCTWLEAGFRLRWQRAQFEIAISKKNYWGNKASNRHVLKCGPIVLLGVQVSSYGVIATWLCSPSLNRPVFVRQQIYLMGEYHFIIFSVLAPTAISNLFVGSGLSFSCFFSLGSLHGDVSWYLARFFSFFTYSVLRSVTVDSYDFNWIWRSKQHLGLRRRSEYLSKSSAVIVQVSAQR